MGVRLPTARIPGKITEAAREDIRNKVLPFFGVDEVEYDRARDHVCKEYGLTRAQVATIVTKMKKGTGGE